MWIFDWKEGAWSGPIEVKSDVIPEPRSFHQLTAVGDLIYCFGGCGENGRLNDLHVFDTNTACWTRLPTCDQMAGRGGACFAASASGTSLYVVAGFDGQETKDMYRYDISTQVWTKLNDFPE